MKKSKQATLAAAVSASLAAFAVGTAHAANPFSVQPLSQGYTVAEMDKAQSASCGAAKAKAKAKTQTKAKAASCGANKAKATDASMKQGAMPAKKTTEANCGASK